MKYMCNLLYICCFFKELGVSWQPTVILHLQPQGKDVIYEQWSVLTLSSLLAGKDSVKMWNTTILNIVTTTNLGLLSLLEIVCIWWCILPYQNKVPCSLTKHYGFLRQHPTQTIMLLIMLDCHYYASCFLLQSDIIYITIISNAKMHTTYLIIKLRQALTQKNGTFHKKKNK